MQQQFLEAHMVQRNLLKNQLISQGSLANLNYN